MRNSDDNDYNSEQRAHERMKAWMEATGWSISIGNDPEMICMLLEERGECLNNRDLNGMGIDD